MDLNNRKSISDLIKKYCCLKSRDCTDCIEITEWTNGEGWDIVIGDNNPISLSRGELDAIEYLTKALDYED